MKIDITSMFFNSKIEGQTATPAWGTSIGQNKSKGCRIDDFKQEVVDMVIGMTYKSITDRENLDVSKGSSDRDIIICSVFNDVYINNQRIDNAQYVLLLVREHSKSHDGRLLISYAPYIKYGGVTNQDCINKMQNILGCNDDGCWFVYDISIKNQAELSFSAVVVNPTSPMIYSPSTSSRERSKEWKSMIPVDYEDFDIQPLLSEPLQQIFYGAPGTGKSHKVNETTEQQPKENVFRTTFHPDSDYSTFVGCYKPTMKPTGVILASKENEEVITYKFVAQAFTKAYVRAWQTTEPVFLVIEEINRGNCAQIFGDLFQLLDRKDGVSEYPVDADTDLANFIRTELANSSRTDIPAEVKDGQKLLLPANLYIWATMNTSDQSLFPIDSAFKRRWEWKYIPIDTRKENWTIKVDGADYDWSDFLEKINKKIDSTTHSEDKMLGFYFCKAENNTINAERFVNKVAFYLWNDVFKDYGFDDAIFNDENGEKLSFRKFYKNDGTVEEAKVKTFLDKLGVVHQGETSVDIEEELQ